MEFKGVIFKSLKTKTMKIIYQLLAMSLLFTFLSLVVTSCSSDELIDDPSEVTAVYEDDTIESRHKIGGPDVVGPTGVHNGYELTWTKGTWQQQGGVFYDENGNAYQGYSCQDKQNYSKVFETLDECFCEYLYQKYDNTTTDDCLEINYCKSTSKQPSYTCSG